MNINKLPGQVRDDIEMQSLLILKHIAEDIVVIGGWAVRAWVGEKHVRHTIDIDGYTEKDKLKYVKNKLKAAGIKNEESEWGIKFYTEYNAPYGLHKNPDDEVKDMIENLELRIEISPPRIYESLTHHYFEFDVNDIVEKYVRAHGSNARFKIKVPPVEALTANKLGLPGDYKNRFDAGVLLPLCDTDKLLEIIRRTDDWADLIKRRTAKTIGRTKNKDDLARHLLINAGIDIKGHIRHLIEINDKLL